MFIINFYSCFVIRLLVNKKICKRLFRKKIAIIGTILLFLLVQNFYLATNGWSEPLPIRCKMAKHTQRVHNFSSQKLHCSEIKFSVID